MIGKRIHRGKTNAPPKKKQKKNLLQVEWFKEVVLTKCLQYSKFKGQDL